MSNVLLAYGNRVDDATLSGGSWQASLPLANLQDEIQGIVARTTNLVDTNTMFDVDLGDEYPIRTFAIVAHNLGLDDSFRIRAADQDNADFAEVLFDSGSLDVWPAIYDDDEMEWEDPNFWSGQPSFQDRTSLNPTRIVSAPTTITPRYIRVEFVAGSNANGYVQLGRFFVGPAIEPAVGVSYGHSIRFEDPSLINRTLAGGIVPERRGKVRVAAFSTDFLTESEAIGDAFNLQSQAGMTDEVVYQRDPADTKFAIRTQFMGRLRLLDGIANPALEVFGTGWEVEERR